MIGCHKGTYPRKLTKPVELLLNVFKGDFETNEKNFMKDLVMLK